MDVEINDVVIPFNLELARRIKSRSVIGKFIIDGCDKVEFIYESGNPSYYPLLFICQIGKIEELVNVDKNGKTFHQIGSSDVKIKTDVNYAFKCGDVLMNIYNKPFIFNGNVGRGRVGSYCGVTYRGDLNMRGSDDDWAVIRENEKYIRKATEKEEADFAKTLLEKGGQRGGRLVAKFMNKYTSLKTDLKRSGGEVVSDSYVMTLQELSSQAVEKITNFLDCSRQEAFLIIQEWAFEFVKPGNGETEYDSYYDRIDEFIDRKINDMKEKLERKL